MLQIVLNLGGRKDMLGVGVFDGHSGQEASKYVSENLWNQVNRGVEKRPKMSLEITEPRVKRGVKIRLQARILRTFLEPGKAGGREASKDV